MQALSSYNTVPMVRFFVFVCLFVSNFLSHQSTEYREVMSVIDKEVASHRAGLKPGEPQFNMCDQAVMVHIINSPELKSALYCERGFLQISYFIYNICGETQEINKKLDVSTKFNLPADV